MILEVMVWQVVMRWARAVVMRLAWRLAMLAAMETELEAMVGLAMVGAAMVGVAMMQQAGMAGLARSQAPL